jgi:hypothetical protein
MAYTAVLGLATIGLADYAGLTAGPLLAAALPRGLTAPFAVAAVAGPGGAVAAGAVASAAACAVLLPARRAS